MFLGGLPKPCVFFLPPCNSVLRITQVKHAQHGRPEEKDSPDRGQLQQAQGKTTWGQLALGVLLTLNSGLL